MTTRTTKTEKDAAARDIGNGTNHRPSDAKQVATEKLQAYGSHYLAEPARDLGSELLDYAKRNPDVAALWCFGLGMIVGWKLRG